MAFPFPPNPVDGQVATQQQADGTVLRATYNQTNNEWFVQRIKPNDPTVKLISNTTYTVTPGKDGQVLTFDKASNQWIGKAPAAGGGAGQTYAKGTQAAPDTPNPPDPTKPAQLLQTGALQSTLENQHHELKTWDGTAWSELFSEDTIKQWISAGSLFRGVIKEATLSTLPDVALGNRGFYWSWTGSPGYVVQKGDAKIGADLENEVLQVGDWIQSDGTKWVHVPGDLLSKQRWDSLGSFAPWSDTSWEKGSVVSHQKAFFRASALISPGDLAPGATPANPGDVQKWVDITPLPHMSTGDLNNVNANTITGGGIHGAVFQWDDNVQEWVASDVLQIGAVRFDDAGVGPEVTGFASFAFSEATPSEEDSYVPSIQAVKEYVENRQKPFLEELEDCAELGAANNDEVPAWSTTNQRWEPKPLPTSGDNKFHRFSLASHGLTSGDGLVLKDLDDWRYITIKGSMEFLLSTDHLRLQFQNKAADGTVTWLNTDHGVFNEFRLVKFWENRLQFDSDPTAYTGANTFSLTGPYAQAGWGIKPGIYAQVDITITKMFDNYCSINARVFYTANDGDEVLIETFGTTQAIYTANTVVMSPANSQGRLNFAGYYELGKV